MNSTDIYDNNFHGIKSQPREINPSPLLHKQKTGLQIEISIGIEIIVT